MSWLDPFIIFEQGGVELTPRRVIVLGPGIVATDDPVHDRLLLNATGGVEVQAGGESDAPLRSTINFGDGLVVDDDPENDRKTIRVVDASAMTVLDMVRGGVGYNLPHTQFNGTGAIEAGLSGADVPYRLTRNVMMRIDLGSVDAYHPGLRFGLNGVGVGWTVYLVVKGGSSNTDLTIYDNDGGGPPLFTISPSDYYRVHAIIFTGAGAGQHWKRLTT